MNKNILSNIWKFLVISIIVVLAEMISHPPLQKEITFLPGSVSNRTILSPIDFYIAKTPDSIESERFLIEDTITRILERIGVKNLQIARLDSFVVLFDSSIVDFVDTMGIRYPTYHSQLTEKFYNWLNPENITLSQFDSMISTFKSKDISNIKESIEECLDSIESIGYISNFTTNTQRSIIIISNDSFGNKMVNEPQSLNPILMNIDDFENGKLLYSAFNKKDTLLIRSALKRIAIYNLIYNDEWTQARIDTAQRLINIYTDIKVSKGAEILRKHQQISIYDSIKIASLIDQLGEDNPLNLELFGNKNYKFKEGMGRLFNILLIFWLCMLFIHLLSPKVWKSSSTMILFFIIIAISVLFSTLLIKYIYPIDSNLFPQFPSENLKSNAIILAPVGLAGMLIVLLIGVKEAIITVFMLSIMIGIYWNYSLNVVLVLITGNLSLIAASRKIYRRSQFYKGLLAMFISMTLISFSLYLMVPISIKSFGSIILMLGIGSTLSVFFALGLISIFERLSNKVTDMKLIELSMDTQPLLHKMARVAQGTKYHSLIVGDISEAAAREIGANPILARVGAYYHDIGKMLHPEFFIENQGFKGKNIHDNILPKESVKLLKNHIVDGVDLAKKNKLPDELIEFIETHHGKMTIEIFLYKAKELEKNGGEKVNEEYFQYDGPIPISKEASIVMLADSIEAACRSIKNPTEEDIENKIKTIIQKRISTGQLNNSLLSLNEINKIQEVFSKMLSGFHHPRIQYPSDKNETNQNSG